MRDFRQGCRNRIGLGVGLVGTGVSGNHPCVESGVSQVDGSFAGSGAGLAKEQWCPAALLSRRDLPLRLLP